MNKNFKKKVKLKNFFVLAPMCQYMAKNGEPTEWHYQHLGKAILSGFSKIMLESTKSCDNLSEECKLLHTCKYLPQLQS